MACRRCRRSTFHLVTGSSLPQLDEVVNKHVVACPRGLMGRSCSKEAPPCSVSLRFA